MANLKDDEVALMLECLDKIRIRDIINKYFFGLDRRDWDAVSSCFTSDARWESKPETVDRSSETVVRNGIKVIIEKLHKVEQFSATSHLATSQSIKIRGDTAAAETFAIAHCIFGPVDRGRIFVRGLLYVDELFRTAEGWRIQHRVHITIWQYEADTVPTGLP